MPQKQLGQLYTHLPAATEHCNRSIKVVVTESQTQQYLLGRLASTAAA